MADVLPGPRDAGDTTRIRTMLSTNEVPVAQRLDYWTDVVCALYAQVECHIPENEVPSGEIEFVRIGSLDLTALRSNARRVRLAESAIRGAAGEHCLVHLQRKGVALVSQDGRTATVAPGDFVMYESTRPYELSCDDPEHDVIILRLPRMQLASHVGGLADLTASTLSGRSTAGNLLISMIDTLRTDAEGLHPSSVLSVSEAIISIIAAGLWSLPGANQRRPSQLSMYHIERIKRYVQHNLRDPELSIASVARAMKLSPDHVARLFRGEAMPLSRLIWQQRVASCRRDLADPRFAERSVSEIAFSWGFNDAAHFSHSFREHFGMSPREWRSQANGMSLRSQGSS